MKSKSKFKGLVLLSELEPTRQKQVLDYLVFVDKAIQLRQVKSEADVRAFIIGYLTGKQTLMVGERHE